MRRHRRLHRELLARRVRRDLSRAEPDLVEDDVLDRAVRVALLPVRSERVVEVRPDRPARVSRLQRVAAGALRREELLPVLDVRPLSAARDWSEGRFLTIAVDQNRTGASGCSIDGLFRTLKALETQLGAAIVTSGLIFFRDRDGRIRSVTRDEFTELGAAGIVDGQTEVFDPSVTTLGEWRSRFTSRAADSWHASLLAARAG